MNFWDNSHPLAKDNERLYDELVPSSGNSTTMQGEMLRAAGKIGYDWYNNGWGCNNWSGSVVFLGRFADDFAQKRTAEEKAAFKKAIHAVHDYSHGEPADISDEKADELVTTIMAYVVQNVLDNPAPVANTRDMYDFQEDAYEGDDEDDESRY